MVVQDCLRNSVEDEQQKNKPESKNEDDMSSDDDDKGLENQKLADKSTTENFGESDDMTDTNKVEVANITRRKLIMRKSSELSTKSKATKKVKRLKPTSQQSAKQVDNLKNYFIKI